MPHRDWHGVFDRRLPQWLGVYLAGGWGILEFTSWAADRALVPGAAVNSVLLGWVALLPVGIYLSWRMARLAPPTSRSGDVASVAVLPFASHSPVPDDAFLSDGLTDEITTALSRIIGLRVASRTSTHAIARRGGDARQIGQRIGVGAILEGEVQRSGDRLRVSTRLVDVADGCQIWSARYDADMADVFAIEDQIAESVGRALEVLFRRGSGAGLRRAHRGDVRAYECYLRGRQFFHDTRLRSLRYARTLFRRAIEIDPSYAPAYAALADAIALERTYYPGAETDLAEADRASRRALELAPELPEAHSARGFVLFISRRLAEAEAAFNQALRLDPRLFEAHYFLARMRFEQGQFEEAALGFERAAAVHPDYQASFFGAQAYEALGSTAKAEAAYRSAVDRVAEHMELNPDDPRAATMRAVALCRTGRRKEGLEWGRRAMEIDPDDAGVRYNVACLYAVAGRVDECLDTLEAAVRAGFGNHDWLERDPDLAAVRGHPRFEALLAAPGAPASPGVGRGPPSTEAPPTTPVAAPPESNPPKPAG